MALHVESVRDEEVERALQRLDTNDPKAEKILFQLAHNITQRLTRGAYRAVKSDGTSDVDLIAGLLSAAYEVPDANGSERDDDSEPGSSKVLPIRTGTNDDSNSGGV